MSTSNQKVLIIQDASKELCAVSIREALRSLSLTPGAKVKLLGIIPAFRTAHRFYPLRCGLGLKSRLQSSVTINKKKEDIEQQVQQMMDEYSRCSHIARIWRQAEIQKVGFEIAVEAGSLKEVAVDYAKSYGATHVILPRYTVV
ncbi:uncharacterized protein LOC111365653 [Olea europaea var. sylvestris]|uniref:uncharacterized protein LOC111365653 n=1 Tax=Olea europaea var. sylvestris TaxID=158386 RepID=UPI000C1D058F|nr:uncharacterized protein LOC111365653 [Olea europaea var. sylvestris]